MSVISEFRTEARPDHGLIQVYDSDAYTPDTEATERCRQTVVASSGPQLYLRSLQGTAPVEIIVRVWEGPAADGGWDLEGWAAAVLESPTGNLVVRAFSPEIAGIIALPRPGVYAVHVSWRGRQAGADQEHRLLAELGEEGGSEDSAVFAAHREVLETYRIDLWWQNDSAADERND